MCTRNGPEKRDSGGSSRPAGRLLAGGDPAEQVALAARARRELLLRVHRFRLRREDLEDCYSQATLELVAHARRGGRFASPEHLANAIEQRFLSRVQDRRRALSGRSPMQAAMESAMSLHGEEEARIEVVDRRAQTEHLVILRQELRRVVALTRALSVDQRLVLASQLGEEEPSAEFCTRHGWSQEKYRKVAQRARRRLRSLMELDEGCPARVDVSEETSGTRL